MQQDCNDKTFQEFLKLNPGIADLATLSQMLWSDVQFLYERYREKHMLQSEKSNG